MANTSPTRLTVTVSGNTLYVEVPSPKAESLLRYLRSKGVPTSTPSPHRAGTDSIELGKGSEAKAVQALLDKWAA